MLIACFNLPYSLAMRDIEHEFSLIRTDRRVVPSGRLWNPAADVYRSDNGWVVKVDLAGICSDELEIELRDSLLTIRGCRRDTHRPSARPSPLSAA